MFMQHVSSQRGENILFIRCNLPTNGARYQFAKLFNVIKICATGPDVFCHIQEGGLQEEPPSFLRLICDF